MFQIKMILDDILDIAYQDSEKLDLYKRYYVEFVDKNLKSMNGKYTYRHIFVYNLYRDDNDIVKTTLHELAHHVDTMNRGMSGHDDSFYSVYKKLLYTALDMDIFDKESYLATIRNSSDHNKVIAMIKSYQPQKLGYKKNQKRIVVKNGYIIKDILADRGYKYNKFNQTWEKEIATCDLETETDLFYDHNIDYTVQDATKVYFNRKRKIIARRGSYDIRKELSKEGFHFEKQKKYWVKDVPAEDLKQEFDILRKKFPNAELLVD